MHQFDSKLKLNNNNKKSGSEGEREMLILKRVTGGVKAVVVKAKQEDERNEH